jgi:hypothetical protein
MLQLASNPDDIRWLPLARLNIAESALCCRDQDAPALVWATEEAPDVVRALTLGELRLRAQRFAAALVAAGITPGLLLLLCASSEHGKCPNSLSRFFDQKLRIPFVVAVDAGCLLVGSAKSRRHTLQRQHHSPCECRRYLPQGRQLP